MIDENKKQKEVILLNKPFLGNWLDDPDNIGHEIIDFLRTDNGDTYIYNNPYGQCPNSAIGVNDSKKKYNAKYLVLTGKEDAKRKSFEILYVIELKELLHRQSSTLHKKKENRDEKEEKELRYRQSLVRKIIDKEKIYYNGKILYDIWEDDDTLYVTFKASKVYKAIVPILVQMSQYNFQRNKGCLYEDDFKTDFDKINEIIKKGIKNGAQVKEQKDKGMKNSDIDFSEPLLEEFEPRQINQQTIMLLNKTKTFVNLIMQENNEQIFTNMLFSILRYGDLFKVFCEDFKGTHTFENKADFRVFRENKIVEGRMDICGESSNQRVVIENKINSGLNGIKPKDNKTQLSSYYKWAQNEKKFTEPLCFVVVPDARKTDLVKEIEKQDPEMKSIYLVITYKEISEFLAKNKGLLKGYLYEKYVDDIIMSFSNLSKLTKEDFYAQMFIEKTLK